MMMLAATAGTALAAPSAGSCGLIRFSPHHFKPGDCGHRAGIEGSPEEIVGIGNYSRQLFVHPTQCASRKRAKDLLYPYNAAVSSPSFASSPWTAQKPRP